MDHKVLLIDDSAILRRIATNVLTARAGCGEVVTATRATEGFARACASGAGLILVDYQIAGFPRAEFCRRLLDEPRTSHVPVVLLLGPGMTMPPPDSLPVNIVDHLIKPFTPEQLLSTVRSASRTAVETPKRRVAAPAPPVPASATMVPAARQEAAVAVSTAASTRRETHRVPDLRRPMPRPLAPAPDLVRGRAAGHRPAEPARVYNALAAATARRETGVFRVHTGVGATTEVYLDGGQVVVVATHEADRYGEDASEVMPPKVSLAILGDAMADQATNGTPFLLTLGSRGLISKSVAVSLLHRFGQRHFARLWLEPPGTLTFEYESLSALPSFALRLEPRPETVEAWLFEASRHLALPDLATILRHEGLGGVPRQHTVSATLLGSLPSNHQEREFIRRVDGRRNLATIAAGLGIASEAAYLLLYRFRCVGVMDYRAAGSAFVVTPRTSVRRVLPLQR